MTNTTPPHPPHKQPIPVDFFVNLYKDDPHSELSYSFHRHKLHAALNLPANNRWVADWLFQDMQNPFHPNITVPPEAFANSLPIEIMHHFFDVGVSSCPVMHMRGAHPSTSPSQHFHTKGADMLLLPVASANGITVGYSFGSSRHDTPSQPRNDTFSGRFAFESTREELLVISNGDQPGVPKHTEDLMVIMSFMWTPDAVREHCMILCPLRDYNYYNLPNEVLLFTSAEMFVPSQRPVPMDILALQSLFTENGSPDGIDELLQSSPSTEFSSPQSLTPPHENLAGLFELPAATSELPWFLESTGKTQDNIGIPRRPGVMPTSSGAFNMDRLSESLSAIEHSLRGDFYGSREALDFTHPQAQAHPVKTLGMMSARNVVARISRSDKSQGASLRSFAVRMYLSQVLPVISDEQFMSQTEPRGSLPILNSAVMVLQQSNSAKARRIAPLPISTSSGESEETAVLADEEERRKEEKREAKRRRNRLSAARSNEKRREHWRMQQRTLESLQKRVLELEERKRTLVAENELLKDKFTAVSKW